MPRNHIDKKYLAIVIARQLGHLKGISYRDMKGNGRYDPMQEAYKEIYAWAEVLPLEKVEDQKTKSTLEERYFQKMIHAQQMIERTKARIRQREGQLKRAKAQLEKWEQEEIKMEKSAPMARKMVLDIGKE